jgi:hypothetical protein
MIRLATGRESAQLNHQTGTQMKITIRNKSTGEIEPIRRDVCAVHPAWVHSQCGTASEAELQAMLDAYRVEDFFDSEGHHRGADNLGISIEPHARLALYIWENVLRDYTPGIAFALAPSEEEARRAIQKDLYENCWKEIDGPPTRVVTETEGFHLHGGG